MNARSRLALCVGIVLVMSGWLYAQEATVPITIPSQSVPSHAPDQIIWALVASYLFQWVKGQSWFALVSHESSRRVQAFMGAGMAALTAAGIHFAVAGSVLDGAGASITITGITLDGLKDFVFQWASQQAWYDALTHKRNPADGL